MPQAKRPRVLVVGPGPKQVGGLATFLSILLASESLRRQYDLIHVDTTRGERGAGKASELAPINLLYLLRDVLSFIVLSVRVRPQILHVPINSMWAFWKDAVFIVLARLFGMKVVGHLHGGYFQRYYESQPALVRRLIGFFLRRAHVVVALSEHWKEVLLGIRPDLDVVVVPNTVDWTYAGAIERATYGDERDASAVLYLGALGKLKGIYDLIEAARLVRDRRPATRFLFAGTASTAGDQAAIESACRDAGVADAVTFLGHVAGQDKLHLMLRSSLYVLPSHVENLPYSLLEAMCAGLPVVATPVGAIPEMVTNGVNGYLVPVGDAAGLAERLVRLLDDEALRRQMSAANLAVIRARFLPEVAMAQFAEIYGRLLDRSGATLTPAPLPGGEGQDNASTLHWRDVDERRS